MADLILTPGAVDALWDSCFHVPTDSPNDRVRIDGVADVAHFSVTRLQNSRERIVALLLELPEKYHETAGNGWTVLNACVDRHGRMWATEPRHVERLVMLGLAVRLVRFPLPRDLWSCLPNGMPYFVIANRDLPDQGVTP